jgi:cob(I)alamin adenosyltransferase
MYTRGGDKGETGLYGAKRVSKDSPRIEACGAVDELNSCVGVALSDCRLKEVSEELRWVQRKLFVVGADLSSDRSHARESERLPTIAKEDTKRLEGMIDGFQERLPRLVNFILPGGSRLSAELHLARSVCRRAERAVVSLNKKEDVNPELLPFLNRLSTYLFNAARFSNKVEGVKDEVWTRD